MAQPQRSQAFPGVKCVRQSVVLTVQHNKAAKGADWSATRLCCQGAGPLMLSPRLTTLAAPLRP
jgi:hypothetical protein